MDARNPENASVYTDGLPAERRRWAALTIFTALAMASLDTAIANVALPAMATDLNVSPAEVVWVVNIYQIAMVTTLLPFAALGDIVGLKRLYLVGLVLFTAGSLACAFSTSLPMLLVARAAQGLGASSVMSINTAMVRFIYPRRLLGQGFGWNALVVAISFSVGPTVAAGVLSVAHWPWLFGINVPFGVVAVFVAMKTLPETPRGEHAFDMVAALMASACLGLFIYGLGSVGHGVNPFVVIGVLIGALLLGILLVRRQSGHPAPMLPVDLFRRPMFALSALTAFFSFSTQQFGLVSLPFLFEHTLGLTAVATGLLITPWSVVVGIMAPIAGRLSNRFPVGILGGIGLAVLSVGMVLLATLPAHPSVADIVWRMAVCGCGFGFFQTPNMRALMGSAPPERAGGASGIVATARLIGQTSGATLTALCFGWAGASGPTYALMLGAVFSGIGAVVSFFRLAAEPGRG
ncbi:MAG: MFS transporter [Proteobacteria bacterium]|nr:MFS transporter [Pseudomonadota bacterium]